MFWLYRAATYLASPFVPLLLKRRLARGKEHPTRWRERLGHPTLPRPDGPLVWIHAASVGESVSIRPLVEALRDARPDVTILLTTVTVTSAALAAAAPAEQVLHQFAPVDTPAALRRFLTHWRPSLAIMVESELWPNMLRLTAHTGCPLALVNARMSDRSFRRWRRIPALIRPLLSQFRLILAQSDADAERLRLLGAPSVAALGNLKTDTPPLPVDAGELARMEREFASRRCWLAASTHPGEEAQLAAVHTRLLTQHPDLILILVPRHPARGAELAAQFRGLGIAVAQRSEAEFITPATQCYLADTMGELGLFYRLAPIAFIGGSLVPHGGQNLLEPARLGTAILCGPHMFNFAELTNEMLAVGGCRQVADADALAKQLEILLQNPEQVTALAENAETATRQHHGVVARVLDRLLPLLLDERT